VTWFTNPPEMSAILNMSGKEYKLIVTKVDCMSSCDRMTEVNISGFFDDLWKNEKETAPVMAAPKRKKPQRAVKQHVKRQKPKHKYPLLYKNSWNTDWGNAARFVDLGNHEYINTNELMRAFNELFEKGQITIHNCEIPANQKLADHLMAFTKNIKAAETDALQKAADDVLKRSKCLW
jgi:hypothetical protein